MSIVLLALTVLMTMIIVLVIVLVLGRGPDEEHALGAWPYIVSAIAGVITIVASFLSLSGWSHQRVDSVSILSRLSDVEGISRSDIEIVSKAINVNLEKGNKL